MKAAEVIAWNKRKIFEPTLKEEDGGMNEVGGRGWGGGGGMEGIELENHEEKEN